MCFVLYGADYSGLVHWTKVQCVMAEAFFIVGEKDESGRG